MRLIAGEDTEDVTTAVSLQMGKEKQLRGPHMRLIAGEDTEDVTTAVSLQMGKEMKEKREISRDLHPAAGDVEASAVEEDHEGSTVDASSEAVVAVEVVEVARIMDMMMAMKERWKVMVPCEDAG